ncbi:hypothetical protein BDP27DRAFT_1311499 [Rhodocollybia butyracea]|uniref:Uncharacterized protein n=1 Tax=Rhodocollybia butyracea TaxID=206335 RepID=A0A9P5UFV9_9AGAR|nr:hypothetical protein BDP27DRAFT_1311499 [Rhodocollybia butyracea]
MGPIGAEAVKLGAVYAAQANEVLAPIGQEVGKHISAAAVAIEPYTKDMDPAVPKVIGAVAGAAVGIALAPVVAPAVLGIVGFGGKGVVAGSAAAGIQAGIGNVAAGSLFAGAQSVAMGGILPAIGSIAAAGLGGLAGAGVAAAVQDVNAKSKDSQL